MSCEQPLETPLVSRGEMIVPFQQTEPGAEQVRFVGGFHSWGLATLQFSSYQGELLGEPSGGVETVQDIKGSGKNTIRRQRGRNGEPSVTTVRTKPNMLSGLEPYCWF